MSVEHSAPNSFDVYGTPCFIDSGERNTSTKGAHVLLDCLRIGVAFGAIALLIAFWYWLMDSFGTF